MDVIPIPFDVEALTRDRAVAADTALVELRLCIVKHDLRQPVEVFEVAEPRGALHAALRPDLGSAPRRRLPRVRQVRAQRDALQPYLTGSVHAARP